MNIALLAHAGHGSTEGSSLLHQITEPLHVSFLLVSVAVVFAVASVIRLYARMQLERAKRLRR